jgi:D-tagatose-1,6-bisphosphate aldolase subunit GatZ/KbaZ
MMAVKDSEPDMGGVFMGDLLGTLKEKHLNGETGGMVSVCSSHPLVLQSAMQLAVKRETPLLVEATSAQVNQFGGYTGMTPLKFAGFVKNLAKASGLSSEKIILGADHLGPHLWKHEPAETAMQKAEELVRQCVSAGYAKIHLDTASPCADDAVSCIPVDVVALRGARLCRAAEEKNAEREQENSVFYVIGNEVPVPGGGLEEGHGVPVTDSDALLFSLEEYRRVFQSMNLSSAWTRMMGMVVQPGVDFGDSTVAAYDSIRAKALSACHGRLPGIMTFEIHATDYQTPEALKNLVQDHFLLLKTGPCLTFALRKTLYALADIENLLPGISSPSRLVEVMENLMVSHPVHWQSHYRGGAEEEQKYLRHHSLRDRIRYYWALPEAVKALETLVSNLSRPVPPALIKAFLPDLYADIEHQEIFHDPVAILGLGIQKALTPYMDACFPYPSKARKSSQPTDFP